ncbi:hypothetical protein [Candidatus Binatus sp.]|uniref:hypothetical protein n=1 Tax=Candidatus Binatus sp. TaxID=2811406 RepID=UPI003CC622CD
MAEQYLRAVTAPLNKRANSAMPSKPLNRRVLPALWRRKKETVKPGEVTVTAELLEKLLN